MPAEDAESLDAAFLAILRCPKCRSVLRLEHGELVCAGADCGLIYRVDRGIPDLIISEARAPKPARS
jgi:hypothetical protein